MKRMAMLRGPRRSAKRTVQDYTAHLIRVLNTQGLPPDRQREFRNHLGAVLMISREMNWEDVTARVTNWIRSNPMNSCAPEMPKRGVFTEPE